MQDDKMQEEQKTEKDNMKQQIIILDAIADDIAKKTSETIKSAVNSTVQNLKVSRNGGDSHQRIGNSIFFFILISLFL